MGSRQTQNIQSAKKNLTDSINKLTEDELLNLEMLLQNRKKDIVKSSKLKNQEAIESILAKLLDDPSCSILHLRLSKHIQEDWETIKRAQLLTRYVITSLERFDKVEDQSMFHRRLNKGSETGSYFENTIASVINWYLSSQTSLWHTEKNLGVEVLINSPIIIPGNRNKKKADILITDINFGKPLVVLELKKSFTKASLKKTFKEESNQYSKLGPDLKYLFVIFNASKTKTKTYKQITDCRVICNDYGLWDRSIEPLIVDPIESILEEIFNHLNNMKEQEKTTASKDKQKYWLCTESVKTKNGPVAFKEGKKYLQLRPIKEDRLLLLNEQGNEHHISPELRGFQFKEVIN